MDKLKYGQMEICKYDSKQYRMGFETAGLKHTLAPRRLKPLPRVFGRRAAPMIGPRSTRGSVTRPARPPPVLGRRAARGVAATQAAACSAVVARRGATTAREPAARARARHRRVWASTPIVESASVSAVRVPLPMSRQRRHARVAYVTAPVRVSNVSTTATAPAVSSVMASPARHRVVSTTSKMAAKPPSIAAVPIARRAPTTRLASPTAIASAAIANPQHRR